MFITMVASIDYMRDADGDCFYDKDE